MSMSDAERHRRYRERHRDEINARRRETDRHLTPEQKEARRQYKKKWRDANRARKFGMSGTECPARPGRRGFLSKLSSDERKAHQAAIHTQWRQKNAEHCREWYRAYYLKKRKTIIGHQKRYVAAHYQQVLQRDRKRHRAENDATRTRPYRPKPSLRVPEYIASPPRLPHRPPARHCMGHGMPNTIPTRNPGRLAGYKTEVLVVSTRKTGREERARSTKPRTADVPRCIDCGCPLTSHEQTRKMARCRRCADIQKVRSERRKAALDGVNTGKQKEPWWMAVSRRIKARFKANRRFYESFGDPVR